MYSVRIVAGDAHGGKVRGQLKLNAWKSGAIYVQRPSGARAEQRASDAPVAARRRRRAHVPHRHSRACKHRVRLLARQVCLLMYALVETLNASLMKRQPCSFFFTRLCAFFGRFETIDDLLSPGGYVSFFMRKSASNDVRNANRMANERAIGCRAR